MSRIRSVHPGFFTDENLVSCSVTARLLFIGLGIEADDKGLFEWKPLTIKMRIFPADHVAVEELLAELVNVGAVKQYTMNGRNYGAIRNFRKFQKPKTPNDIYPATAEILAFTSLASEPSGDNEVPFPPKGETLPQNGENVALMEEGGEEEGNPPTPRKRGSGERAMIPADWEAPLIADLPPRAEACARQWSAASYATHGEAFRNYWRSERKMKADWNGTWANRIVDIHDKVMRSQKFGNAPPDTPRADFGPDGGKLFQSYQAGDISFEEFNRRRGGARQEATGPPRPIGQVLRAVP